MKGNDNKRGKGEFHTVIYPFSQIYFFSSCVKKKILLNRFYTRKLFYSTIHSYL